MQNRYTSLNVIKINYLMHIFRVILRAIKLLFAIFMRQKKLTLLMALKTDSLKLTSFGSS